MSNGIHVEKWTREQCEEYLKQYPKSLNSEAVRKRLAFLTPEPPSPEQKKSDKSEQNVADIVESMKTAKKEEINDSGKPEPQPAKSSTSSTQRFKPKTSSTYVDPHEKDMAVVGKVVLTILVLVLCFGIVMLCVELFGGESAIYTGPVCAGVAIPLANKIWKK